MGLARSGDLEEVGSGDFARSGVLERSSGDLGGETTGDFSDSDSSGDLESMSKLLSSFGDFASSSAKEGRGSDGVVGVRG